MLKIKNFDLGLFLAWFLLVSIGIIIIYTESITSYGEFTHINNYYIKQLVYILFFFPLFFVFLLFLDSFFFCYLKNFLFNN